MSNLVAYVTHLIETAKSLRDEEGQGLIEYSLIAALIAVVAVTIMTTVGTNIVSVFTTVSTKLAPSS